MLKVSLLLVIFGTAIKTTQSDAVLSDAICTAMQGNIAELERTVERICSGKNPAEWEPLELTSIGVVNTTNTADQSFPIPETVPATANEVFVYMYLKVRV